MYMSHIPVMLDEIMEHLENKDNSIYVDCTFGAGGYSKRILQERSGFLYAIDQDYTVIKFADELAAEYGNRFTFVNSNFSNIQTIAEQNNLKSIDAVIFDLGVSSMQIDEAERGFSFNKDARLDMRMNKKSELTAWDVVNNFTEVELADIIYYYGEEIFSRRVAKSIVNARKINSIDSTLDLVKIIHSSVRKTGKIDPATKTFQALRVYVNDELKALQKALLDSYDLLNQGGKLLIVSFQGLEDRVVKAFIQQKKLRSKLYKPKIEEIRSNPRSRSAKLRVITI
jgi:16S rRNA (cytosine1402-N4)-methyltransferase